MSRIDDLLRELAPDGVPVRRLAEVGEFSRGAGMQKSVLTTDGFPAIHYGQIHTRYGVWIDRTLSFVDPVTAARLPKARPGDLIIATTSEDDAAVAKATAWLGCSDVAVSSDAHIFHHRLDPKFLSYYFKSANFQTQKLRRLTGAKVRRISADAMANLEIPVPPLRVQHEIVRTLDQFTQLEAELEAELEARRRQLSEYRRALICQPGVEFRALGDLASFQYGYTESAAIMGDLRFLRITDLTFDGRISSENKKFVKASPSATSYIALPGDILVARTGGTFGRTAMVGSDEAAVFASFLIRVRPDALNLDGRYYWHFAQSLLYWNQANAIVSKSGQPQFNANALAKLRVPVPALRDQRRIARTLDRLDMLTNDLTIGLPAELRARRKQYEHYRDKLLTFKEAST